MEIVLALADVRGLIQVFVYHHTHILQGSVNAACQGHCAFIRSEALSWYMQAWEEHWRHYGMARRHRALRGGGVDQQRQGKGGVDNQRKGQGLDDEDSSDEEARRGLQAAIAVSTAFQQRRDLRMAEERRRCFDEARAAFDRAEARLVLNMLERGRWLAASPRRSGRH